MDVLDSTVRHQQAMLEIKIYPRLGRPMESLQEGSPVVGMNLRQHRIHTRLEISTVFKDVVGFIGPEHFSTRNCKADAACMAYALPLSQEAFAPLQIRIKASILQRNRGLRSQQLQHRNPVGGEGVRSQIVLQIERTDKLGLF